LGCPDAWLFLVLVNVALEHPYALAPICILGAAFFLIANGTTLFCLLAS
jgi:hypothetical protein